MKDYYKILGLSSKCENKEIKTAYRKKAIYWHPDKNSSPDAHYRFIEVKEAYEILSNPEKRRAYDSFFQDNGQKTKNPKQEGEFKKWTEEAVNEAKSDLNLPIQKFIEKIDKAVDAVQYGCGMIFMIWLWLCWGPFNLLCYFYMLPKFIDRVERTGIQESFWPLIGVILILLFGLIVSFKGLKYIRLISKYWS